jgi:hypothetical protein
MTRALLIADPSRGAQTCLKRDPLQQDPVCQKQRPLPPPVAFPPIGNRTCSVHELTSP